MKPTHLILTSLGAAVMLLTSCASRDYSNYSRTDPTLADSEAAVASGFSQAPLVTVSDATGSLWPLTFAVGSTNATVYRPTIDFWDGERVQARSAVALQAVGQLQPTYGVVNLEAITLVDKNTRKVSLEEAKLTQADFPSAPERAGAYLDLLRSKFPKELGGMALDNFEASLSLPARPTTAAQALNDTPPRVIVSAEPALLVSIDGPPAYRPVAGTALERVINTRVLLFRNPAGEQFLHVLDGYLQAPRLEGPWTLAPQVPAGATTVEQAAEAAGGVDLLKPESGADTNALMSLASGSVPKIYVSTKPAELLTFDGAPQFAPVAGTHLLYAANTSANVFQDTVQQRMYILLSGRWYSAGSLDGPWQFVPSSRLPPDFAQIPDSSPKENVKASVPGTRQAAEALIANAIPQSSRVPRTSTMPAPQMDGAPQLRPISGTPLSYVVNSGTPILRVNDQTWFACQNGVWFRADSVYGPWVVASAVPSVIYTIPVTSPLHYLTYVRVYGASPDSVYEGYTPGYFGTEVSPDDTVVYGTGYLYDPWIGETWYEGPCTWGYGWGPCWNPWDDWCYGPGFGWGIAWVYALDRHHRHWHCPPPRPGWGPYQHGRHGHGGRPGDGGGAWVSTSHRAYGRSGDGRRVASELGPAYNSSTGALLASRMGTGFGRTPELSGVPVRRTLGGSNTGSSSQAGTRFSASDRFITPSTGPASYRGELGSPHVVESVGPTPESEIAAHRSWFAHPSLPSFLRPSSSASSGMRSYFSGADSFASPGAGSVLSSPHPSGVRGASTGPSYSGSRASSGGGGSSRGGGGGGGGRSSSGGSGHAESQR